jgi:DNA mismatch repair protein MutL
MCQFRKLQLGSKWHSLNRHMTSNKLCLVYRHTLIKRKDKKSSMSDIIQLLPDSVANQIAAGEVIQRPASVVKELVENAVDAGSTHIQIILKDAGRTLIQIIDNGCGMSETDARMGFERHATSKIKNANDLFAIRTMGFRGEALASIAAVAQVELKTRPHENELGTHIQISGSKIERQEPIACAPGSNFIVKNLFYNIPARRRFLKTNATELRHIINEFQRISLANPDIKFTLTHNEQILFNIPSANLLQRITGVIGKQINPNLVPVKAETSVFTINGFIGKPQTARKTMGDQFFFVNNRYMRSPYLHKAVTKAYENLVPAGHCPPYFLFFDIDPNIIDVNIHPTKTEIKFEDERSVWKIVNASTREALGKYNMVPSIDFNQSNNIDIPNTQPNTTVSPPHENFDPFFNPFEKEGGNPVPSYNNTADKSQSKKNWEALYNNFENSMSGDDADFNQSEAIILPSHDSEAKHDQTDVFDASTLTEKNETGPLYFQLKNRYIITSVKSGIMIIDQRRAHERILFESFLNNINSGKSVSQQSLFPEEIKFSENDAILLREINDDLKLFGFEILEKEPGTFFITSQPSFIKNINALALIDSILEAFQSGEVDTNQEIQGYLAAIMAQNACMRPGERLTQAEMAELINKLFLCSAPNYTSSGKIVFSVLDNEELEKRFR